MMEISSQYRSYQTVIPRRRIPHFGYGAVIYIGLASCEVVLGNSQRLTAMDCGLWCGPPWMGNILALCALFNMNGSVRDHGKHSKRVIVFCGFENLGR